MDVFKTVLQPFPVHFDCHDYHIMFYMKNHPEYESAEAMINTGGDGKHLIRAILTMHDGSQVDHINDWAAVEGHTAQRKKRKTIYSPMEYERTEEKGKAHVVLKFRSFKGEDVSLDLYAAAAVSASRTGLIDPGGHSPDTSLPVMFPERTTLAGPKSNVTIDGIKYELPVKIHIPILFKGMKGYYSENFIIGVFREGVHRLETCSMPVCLAAGEQWVYKDNGIERTYEITEVNENTVSIKSRNEILTLEYNENKPGITAVSFISTAGDGSTADLSISFKPALPLGIQADLPSKSQSDFIITVKQQPSQITGTVNTVIMNGIEEIYLCPVQPEWAAKRPVYTVIEEDGAGVYSIKTEIKKVLSMNRGLR